MRSIAEVIAPADLNPIPESSAMAHTISVNGMITAMLLISQDGSSGKMS